VDAFDRQMEKFAQSRPIGAHFDKRSDLKPPTNPINAMASDWRWFRAGSIAIRMAFI